MSLVVSSFYLYIILILKIYQTRNYQNLSIYQKFIYPKCRIRLHSEVMNNKCGDNIQHLFKDIDSLMYEVCTKAFNEDMWAMKDNFEFPSYPKSNSFYDPTNNKMMGKF